MRIIGGIHKGRKLASLPGKTTRPTSGKVREAIFNICSDDIPDANVLDLFAGTGAFGLEAISRGAARAVFVDSDRRGIDIIRKNIAACRENERTSVFCTDITTNLNMLLSAGLYFDIVFLDPPYHAHAAGKALDTLSGTGMLRKGAMVIVEHGKREEIPVDITGMEIIDRRKYGKTLVTFLKCM